MNFTEKDWKLFRKMLPDWQERYMERLIQSYAELLDSDMQASGNSGRLSVKSDRTSNARV